MRFEIDQGLHAGENEATRQNWHLERHHIGSMIQSLFGLIRKPPAPTMSQLMKLKSSRISPHVTMNTAGGRLVFGPPPRRFISLTSHYQSISRGRSGQRMGRLDGPHPLATATKRNPYQTDSDQARRPFRTLLPLLGLALALFLLYAWIRTGLGVALSGTNLGFG